MYNHYQVKIVFLITLNLFILLCIPILLEVKYFYLLKLKQQFNLKHFLIIDCDAILQVVLYHYLQMSLLLYNQYYFIILDYVTIVLMELFLFQPITLQQYHQNNPINHFCVPTIYLVFYLLELNTQLPYILHHFIKMDHDTIIMVFIN